MSKAAGESPATTQSKQATQSKRSEILAARKVAPASRRLSRGHPALGKPNTREKPNP